MVKPVSSALCCLSSSPSSPHHDPLVYLKKLIYRLLNGSLWTPMFDRHKGQQNQGLSPSHPHSFRTSAGFLPERVFHFLSLNHPPTASLRLTHKVLDCLIVLGVQCTWNVLNSFSNYSQIGCNTHVKFVTNPLWMLYIRCLDAIHTPPVRDYS